MKKFLLMCLMSLFTLVSYAKSENCMMSDNDGCIVKCDSVAVVAPVAFNVDSLMIVLPVEAAKHCGSTGYVSIATSADTLVDRTKDINLLVHIDPGL